MGKPLSPIFNLGPKVSACCKREAWALRPLGRVGYPLFLRGILVQGGAPLVFPLPPKLCLLAPLWKPGLWPQPIFGAPRGKSIPRGSLGGCPKLSLHPGWLGGILLFYWWEGGFFIFYGAPRGGHLRWFL